MGQISEKIQPSTLFTKKNVINNESITDQHNNQDQGHQINLVEDNLLDKNARNRKSRRKLNKKTKNIFFFLRHWLCL